MEIGSGDPHPLVDILAQLAHRALADAAEPHGLHKVVDAASEEYPPGQDRLPDYPLIA